MLRFAACARKLVTFCCCCRGNEVMLKNPDRGDGAAPSAVRFVVRLEVRPPTRGEGAGTFSGEACRR